MILIVCYLAKIFDSHNVDRFKPNNVLLYKSYFDVKPLYPNNLLERLRPRPPRAGYERERDSTVFRPREPQPVELFQLPPASRGIARPQNEPLFPDCG